MSPGSTSGENSAYVSKTTCTLRWTARARSPRKAIHWKIRLRTSGASCHAEQPWRSKRVADFVPPWPGEGTSLATGRGDFHAGELSPIDGGLEEAGNPQVVDQAIEDFERGRVALADDDRLLDGEKVVG